MTQDKYQRYRCSCFSGGSTRSLWSRRQQNYSLVRRSLDINPETVVAIGAAIQADQLQGKTDSEVFLTYCLSLGLEMMGGFLENSVSNTIPASQTRSHKMDNVNEDPCGSGKEIWHQTVDHY